MSNHSITEQQAHASRKHPGGTLRVFQRLLQKQQTAAERIAREQKEVAEFAAAAESIKKTHDRLVAQVAETRAQIVNAEAMSRYLDERREESVRWSFQKITSGRGTISEVLQWTTKLTDLNGAIAHCRSIVAELKPVLVDHETALVFFENKHAADLEVIAEAAESAS